MHEQPPLDFMPEPRKKITRDPPPPEDGIGSYKVQRPPVCDDCGAEVHQAVKEGRRLKAPFRATKKVTYKGNVHYFCYLHAVVRTEQWGIRWDKKR